MFFIINVDLTEEGLCKYTSIHSFMLSSACGCDYSWVWLLCVTAVHVEDIIFHMFQYIQKLRTEGPQEWVFEECKVINVVCSPATFQTERQDKLDLLISG